METKNIIKFIVIIIVIILVLYFKRQKDREREKVKEIISKFSKNKTKSKTNLVSRDFKKQQVKCLKKFVQTLVNTEKALKTIDVIEKRIQTNDYVENWTIIDELLSDELQNFNLKNNIYLYCYLDWKEDPKELNNFVENSLIKNFNIEKKFSEIIDLSEYSTIPDAFPIYETELNKLRLKLRNIDIGGDCYIIVIIKEENIVEFELLINQMNLKFQQVRPSNWSYLNDIN